MRRRAFTLVELLIVIVIVAVLASIAIPKMSNNKERAHEAALKARLKIIRNALQRANADTGGYPGFLGHLTLTTAPVKVLDKDGNAVSPPAGSWRGPYIDADTAGLSPDGRQLIDPVCGGTFVYSKVVPTIGEVSSCSTGTATDGTDISLW